MVITVEILTANRDALVVERDGYLAQATAVGGAIKILEHLLELAGKPDESPQQASGGECGE